MTRRRSGLDSMVEMLHDLDVFGECTPAELERIAGISTELRVDPGRVLCRQGEFDAEFFVIVDGEAGVDVDDKRATTLDAGASSASTRCSTTAPGTRWLPRSRR